MKTKKILLACALATALAAPTPGIANPSPPSTNNGAIVFVVIAGVVAALLLQNSLSGGGVLSSKGGKTDPYTGRTTGKVIADF